MPFSKAFAAIILGCSLLTATQTHTLSNLDLTLGGCVVTAALATFGIAQAGLTTIAGIEAAYAQNTDREAQQEIAEHEQTKLQKIQYCTLVSAMITILIACGPLCIPTSNFSGSVNFSDRSFFYSAYNPIQ